MAEFSAISGGSVEAKIDHLLTFFKEDLSFPDAVLGRINMFLAAASKAVSQESIQVSTALTYHLSEFYPAQPTEEHPLLSSVTTEHPRGIPVDVYTKAAEIFGSDASQIVARVWELFEIDLVPTIPSIQKSVDDVFPFLETLSEAAAKLVQADHLELKDLRKFVQFITWIRVDYDRAPNHDRIFTDGILRLEKKVLHFLESVEIIARFMKAFSYIPRGSGPMRFGGHLFERLISLLGAQELRSLMLTAQQGALHHLAWNVPVAEKFLDRIIGLIQKGIENPVTLDADQIKFLKEFNAPGGEAYKLFCGTGEGAKPALSELGHLYHSCLRETPMVAAVKENPIFEFEIHKRALSRRMMETALAGWDSRNAAEKTFSSDNVSAQMAAIVSAMAMGWRGH